MSSKPETAFDFPQKNNQNINPSTLSDLRGSHHLQSIKKTSERTSVDTDDDNL